MNIWCVRAHSGRYAEHFRTGNYVGLHYDIGEPCPAGEGREAFVDIYRKYHPQDTSNIAVGLRAGQLQRFCEMKAGDYVITPSENVEELFHGVVEGEAEDGYYFVAEPEDGCPYQHRRPVKWSDEPVLRRSLSVSFQNTLNSALTVFGVSQVEEFLQAIGAEGHVLPPLATYDPYKSVLRQLLKLNAREFEMLVGHLLTAMGFKTRVTGEGADGGVDVVGILNIFDLASVHIHVQAKRYQKDKIGRKAVMDLRGRVLAQEQGAIVTITDFREAAYEAARQTGFPRIRLINGHKLVDLLVEHWRGIPEEFQRKLELQIGLVRSEPTS